jgi:hypothetical protein
VKLADFYAAIGPYLEGRAEHGATVTRLFDDPMGIDAERLAIYARFCRIHRFEAVDFVYSSTRAAIVDRFGLPEWEKLVADYFVAHPMHHVELNENGASLPDYLRGIVEARSWPAWLVELADLEWWEWRTDSALDGESDADRDAGDLRLAATVEVRPYAHDLVGWLDADERAPEPEARAVVVIFWRDGDGDPRRENASRDELLILKAVSEGATTDGTNADTLADLRAAGILLPR